MNKRPSQAPDQRGYVLLLTLIQGVVFMTILMSLVDLAFANYKSANQAYKDIGALAAAEAGADAAVFNLNLGSSYSGTTGPSSNVCDLATSATSSPSAVTFATSPEQGLITYETCITDTSSGPLSEKTVYSVGKVYARSGAAHPMSVRRVKLVVAAQVSGTYSVQTGNGGLALSNSATIANGNVYVNGGLTMTNTSQIGTSASPATVNAANYLCPKTAPYTGYPMLCASGQPISIGNSAHIYADVHANGQTDGSGMTNTGLVQTAGVPTLPMPTYDRTAHKAAVTTVINGTQTCGGTDVVTLEANTRINGSLTGGGAGHSDTLCPDAWSYACASCTPATANRAPCAAGFHRGVGETRGAGSLLGGRAPTLSDLLVEWSQARAPNPGFGRCRALASGKPGAD